MKKFITLIFVMAITLVSTSCGKSNEEKAQALLKDYMFKNLIDFQSYEPVETIIDTLYSTIYTNDEAILLSKKYDICELNHNHLRREISLTKSYMDDLDLFDEYADLQIKSLDNNIEMWGYMIDIKNIADTLSKNHMGWSIKHTYRCKNVGGNYTISTDIFWVDKDFKTVNHTWSESDYHNIYVNLTSINEMSKDSLNATVNDFKDLKESWIQMKNDHK